MACFFTSKKKKKRASCHGMTLFAKHYSGLFFSQVIHNINIYIAQHPEKRRQIEGTLKSCH